MFQILVTHHVDLVLPGAYYFVRMSDGRIDVQGSVEDLRSSGAFGNVVKVFQRDAEEDRSASEKSKSDAEGVLIETSTEEACTEEVKKPRKLVEDEERAVGSVKWAIYRTYLKAS